MIVMTVVVIVGVMVMAMVVARIRPLIRQDPLRMRRPTTQLILVIATAHFHIGNKTCHRYS